MARLIIVEDNSELASLIAAAARARGHEAETAGTGQAGLQAIGGSSFDVAVVDLLLPDMRGGDVLDALRAKNVPAIVVSGVYKGEKFAREAVQQHGAQQFFEKPFDMRTLLQAIELAAGAPLDAEIIEDEEDELAELEELVPLEELAPLEEVEVEADEPLVLPPSPARPPPPPPASLDELPELVAAAPMLSAQIPVLDDEPNTPTRPLDRAELAALAQSFSEQASADAAEDDLEDQDEIPTRVAPPPPGFVSPVASPAAAPSTQPLELELAEALEALEPAGAEAVEPVFEAFELLDPDPPVKAAPAPAEPHQAPPPVASAKPSSFIELAPEPDELPEALPPEPVASSEPPAPAAELAPEPAEPLEPSRPEPVAASEPLPARVESLSSPLPDPSAASEPPPPAAELSPGPTEPNAAQYAPALEPVISFNALSRSELAAAFEAFSSTAEPAPAHAEALSPLLSGPSAASEPPPPAAELSPESAEPAPEPVAAAEPPPPPAPEPVPAHAESPSAPPPSEPAPSKSAPHDVVLPFAERGGVWRKSDHPGRKKALPDWSEAGDLSRSSVPKLLTAFYEARHSGELKLKQDSIIKVVYFEDGHLVYAASNLASERFGRFCVRRGAVTEADLERVNALCEAEKLRTGEALIRLGLLTPERRLALLEEQVREIVWSTFSWTRGQYSLVAKRPGRQELVKLQVFPGELILEGALRNGTLLSLRQKMPPKRRLFPAKDPSYLAQDFALSPPRAMLLAAADGSKTVEDLLALTDLSERDALAALAGFELLGLLEERRDEGKRQRISFGL